MTIHDPEPENPSPFAPPEADPSLENNTPSRGPGKASPPVKKEWPRMRALLDGGCAGCWVYFGGTLLVGLLLLPLRVYIQHGQADTSSLEKIPETVRMIVAPILFVLGLIIFGIVLWESLRSSKK
ncbi:hypothetical protein [Acanthopleuribacter pedis]|uniref:Uncharacterized protein n=1 Tax=Acanthopleuribacter pedis TaxID=442870 RepID=A0A8J7U5X1_9BACT|nr:hypothetical protein [Acanthopleuribacter pedis]MBO1322998.1 hypothetical protein [Acanthopleuribacter pedis]